MKLDLERSEKSIGNTRRIQACLKFEEHKKSLSTAEGSRTLIHSFEKLDLERSEKSVGNMRRIQAYFTAKAAMGNTPKSANKFSS